MIVWIDTVELAFGQRRSISLPLDLSFGTGAECRIHLLLSSACLRQSIEFRRDHGGQKRLRDSRVHARSGNVPAHLQTLMGAEMIAHILPASFVADVHLVTAACAPGDAVQQKIAFTGSSSCLRAQVFGPIVPDDVADCYKSRPVDVGGIPILHDDAPFLDRPGDLSRRQRFNSGGSKPSPSIDKSTRVGGVSQYSRHRLDRRSRPAQVAMPVATRNVDRCDSARA